MRKSISPSGDAFDPIRTASLGLTDVAVEIRYDGSPVLRRRGVFVAGFATHPSAEPGTLVVRSTFEDREWLLEDAPETYYLTDYYRPHPVVLARLSLLDQAALHDLLSVSSRLAAAKGVVRRHGRK
jgi:hypothetical protein